MDGLVVHRVRFSSGARWTIECADIEYDWKPFPPLPPLPVEPEVDDCGIGSRPGTKCLRTPEREALELIESTGGHREPLASFLNRLHTAWGAMSPEEFLQAAQHAADNLNAQNYMKLVAEADWQQGRYLWISFAPSLAGYAQWDDRSRSWVAKHPHVPGKVLVVMTREGHAALRLERAFPPPKPGEDKWLRFSVEDGDPEGVASCIRSLGIEEVQRGADYVDAKMPSELVGRVARLSAVTKIYSAPDMRQLTWSHLRDGQTSAS